MGQVPVPGHDLPDHHRPASWCRCRSGSSRSCGAFRESGTGAAHRPTAAIWLTHTAFALPFGIFLLRNFFITLPKDLIEAARIDGASNVGIFRTIVVPLSVPAIAAYGIFQFLWVWNDLLMALSTRSATPSSR